MDVISLEQTKELVRRIANKIIAEEPSLTEIDRKIGDGDHGIGMKIGMNHVLATIESATYDSIGDLFQSVGMAMLRSMGGASGVLFASLFLGIAKVTKGKTELNDESIYLGLQQALLDIQARGKAKIGDKTMVDALGPAVTSLQADVGRGVGPALENAAQQAYEGVKATKTYVAKYGRAKNLGERTLGFQDAGATSVYLILAEMALFCQSGLS